MKEHCKYNDFNKLDSDSLFYTRDGLREDIIDLKDDLRVVGFILKDRGFVMHEPSQKGEDYA